MSDKGTAISALPVVTPLCCNVCGRRQHSDGVTPLAQSCIVWQQAICACSPYTLPRQAPSPETASKLMSSVVTKLLGTRSTLRLDLSGVKLGYFFGISIFETVRVSAFMVPLSTTVCPAWVARSLLV